MVRHSNQRLHARLFWTFLAANFRLIFEIDRLLLQIIRIFSLKKVSKIQTWRH